MMPNKADITGSNLLETSASFAGSDMAIAAVIDKNMLSVFRGLNLGEQLLLF